MPLNLIAMMDLIKPFKISPTIFSAIEVRKIFRPCRKKFYFLILSQCTGAKSCTVTTNILRPPGQGYNQFYTILRVRSSATVMIWGAMSAQGVRPISIIPQNTMVTAAVYLNIFSWLRQCQLFYAATGVFICTLLK